MRQNHVVDFVEAHTVLHFEEVRGADFVGEELCEIVELHVGDDLSGEGRPSVVCEGAAVEVQVDVPEDVREPVKAELEHLDAAVGFVDLVY
jgi:hypothetical protein